MGASTIPTQPMSVAAQLTPNFKSQSVQFKIKSSAMQNTHSFEHLNGEQRERSPYRRTNHGICRESGGGIHSVIRINSRYANDFFENTYKYVSTR